MTPLMGWASGLCAAGIGCALLQSLCPHGALNKALRVLTALMFFCSLLSPIGIVKDMLSDGFLPSADAAEVPEVLSEKVEEQTEAILEAVLLSDATDRLAEEGVHVKNVRLVRDTEKTESIYIERVQVVFSKEDHPIPADVPMKLEWAWGVGVEVYYSDGS